MSTAVVPIKELAASKSRLFPELAQQERESLALAMLEDVLAALLATPTLDRVAVATPDRRAAEAAERMGAETLFGPDPGLNEAIDAAAGKLRLASDEPYLVVLGDVAGARPEDLETLFLALGELTASTGGRGAALARSSDGGTSALLRAPHDAIPSRFGRDSAAKHREAAQSLRVPYIELDLPSLAIDLDRADDVGSFLSSSGAGQRTRRLLDELQWQSRHASGQRASDRADAAQGTDGAHSSKSADSSDTAHGTREDEETA